MVCVWKLPLYYNTVSVLASHSMQMDPDEVRSGESVNMVVQLEREDDAEEPGLVVAPFFPKVRPFVFHSTGPTYSRSFACALCCLADILRSPLILLPP